MLNQPLLEAGKQPPSQSQLPWIRAHWVLGQLLFSPLFLIGTNNWIIGQLYPDLKEVVGVALICLALYALVLGAANLYLSCCARGAQAFFLFLLFIKMIFITITVVLYRINQPDLLSMTQYAFGTSVCAYLLHLVLSILILLTGDLE